MKKEHDDVIKLDFSDEFLLDSVEDRMRSGDYLGALTMLNKRNSMFPPSADAQALAADIYEGMDIYPLAADAWFRFLDTCNEADFSEGYEGLAVAFMNMGNELHSTIYYNRCYEAENDKEVKELDELLSEEEEIHVPRLSMVYSADGAAPEMLGEGLMLLRSGELDKAREVFGGVSKESSDYATAVGYSAMCTLMLGKDEEARIACENILKDYPDNVQALTTYCAVLGAQGKKKEAQVAALRLYKLHVEETDDLYRIATALCETGLDEEAYHKLKELTEKLPYDDTILYFLAVAAYHTQRLDEAIQTLELLTTIYPRKAVADYYLVRMREQRDGKEKPFAINYFYRVPEDEYNAVASFLLAMEKADVEQSLNGLGTIPELTDFFRIAFDEMEGKDEKLQYLASKVAVKYRQDGVIREMLLDYQANELIKLHTLHDLVLRNEDDSFGVVMCNLYKEFYTHKLDIGKRKQAEFLSAYADVYSKFALLGEENERKICYVAEDVYAAIEDCEAWELIDERASLAAAIYRECRLKRGERSFDKIVDLFGANKYVTQEILNLLM